MGTSNVYQSIYDGPAIDAAIARASEGGHIDAAIQGKPNQNILDNWYFGNPVNQRGQMEYTALGYTIDRWKLPAVHKLTVQDSGIKITCNSSAGVNFCFQQLVENLEVGNQYTLSALITENTTTKGVNLRHGNSGHNAVTGTGVYAFTFVAASTDLTSGVGMQFNSRADDNNNYFVLKAIKLELGSQQTLAHQDADGNWVLNEVPDYGEQLRRCQRYFTKLKNVILNGMTNSGGTMAFVAINLPVPMRAKPSVSSYSFNYGVAGGTKITSVSSNSVYGGESDQSMFYAQFGTSGLPGDTNFAAYMTDLALTADL